jgi:CheY-like chemotaxis protein
MLSSPLETTFLQLAEAASEPCWILGPDALAVHVNAAFSQHTGLSCPAAEALGWLSVLHPADREPHAPWRQGLLGEEPHALELRLRSAQADYHTWQVRAVPLRDGSRRWFLAAHLQVEDALREALTEQARSFVELGNALLDVVRVAHGQSELHKERVALSQLVARVLQAWPGERPSLELALPDELLVDADEHRLAQALLHLLVSTSRHAQSGSLELSAEHARGEVLLRLQYVPLAGPHGELDMSLSLIRSLAELHGGRVEVHQDGSNSVFLLGLPEVGSRSQRILVVEDNEDAAYLLSVLLESAGHEVRVANDPHSALELTETFLPDIAILDIGLPIMDGYELGTRLRAKLEPHRPQLIALSGYGQIHDRQRSAEAGFGIHLVKPVDPDHLLGLVGAGI